MDSFHLEILSPERPFYVGDAISLVVPVSDGMMGVMAHHEPMTAAIMDGAATFTLADGTVKECVMSRGMLDISQNDARVLCDSVLAPEEVEEAKAKEAALEEALKEQEKQALRDYRRAQLAFANAVNTLKNKQKDSMKN